MCLLSLKVTGFGEKIRWYSFLPGKLNIFFKFLTVIVSSLYFNVLISEFTICEGSKYYVHVSFDFLIKFAMHRDNSGIMDLVLINYYLNQANLLLGNTIYLGSQ